MIFRINVSCASEKNVFPWNTTKRNGWQQADELQPDHWRHGKNVLTADADKHIKKSLTNTGVNLCSFPKYQFGEYVLLSAEVMWDGEALMDTKQRLVFAGVGVKTNLPFCTILLCVSVLRMMPSLFSSRVSVEHACWRLPVDTQSRHIHKTFLYHHLWSPIKQIFW